MSLYVCKNLHAYKDKLSRRYNRIYFIIGIIFFIYGICITYKTNYILVKDKEYKKNITMQGVVYAISEKADSYALTITDVCNSNVSSLNSNFHIGKILVYMSKDNTDIAVGDSVFIEGKLCNFSKATNQGQFSEYDYYVKQLGYSYKIYSDNLSINRYELNRGTKKIYYNYKKKLYMLKKYLAKQCYKIYGQDKGAIISAMILGDKSLISKDTKNLYQKMGISHILAISGLHINLLAMLVYKLLTKLKLDINLVNTITILFIISYGIMTDFSISTNRAVVMMVIMLIASITGRAYDIQTALAISGVIILSQNPLRIYNTGMLFSYAAVIAIIVVVPTITKVTSKQIDVIKQKEGYYIDKESGEYVDKNTIHDGRDGVRVLGDTIIEKLVASFSIYLVNLPILINSYYEISICSIIINIIAMAYAELLMIASVLSIFVSILLTSLGKWISLVSVAILYIFEAMGRIVNNIEGNVMVIGHKSIGIICIYYLIIFVTLYMVKINKRWIYALLLCLIIVIPIKDNKVDITLMDVSQGDGICVKTVNNSVITIDCGSTDVKDVHTYRIIPYLKYNGIKTIDYAMISHLDTDHISGIKGILTETSCGISIRHIVIPYVSQKSEQYMELEQLAKKRKVKVIYMKSRDRIVVDNVSFTSLHPNSTYKSDDENGYSNVLLMKYNNFDMLFTGDIGKEQEEFIIKNMSIDKHSNFVDVIKVPHHGSKNSSIDEFIASFSPKCALISAGKENMYGHPHRETIRRYVRNRCKVYTTIDNGAINIKTNGKEMWLSRYKHR